MKKFGLAAWGVLLLSAIPQAEAASLSGTLNLNVTGTFNSQVSQGGNVSCTAAVVLTPNTSGGLTLGSLNATIALNSGVQTVGGSGKVATNRKAFTCSVSLPYSFSNYTSGQQIVVFYSVSGNDNGYYKCGTHGCQFFPPTYKPTQVHRLVTLPSVPPNGTTTDQNVTVVL